MSVAKSAAASKRVCIVGGGNAAHALAALLPSRGYETTMYCPYGDEAQRINAGLEEQDGYMLANFASHNTPSGEVRGKPLIVSKDAADVIPDAEVIVMPLPSFAYPSALQGLKPYLKEGQVLCVTPGQGGFDWFASEILGKELLDMVVLCGVMPMPFNCRIEAFGKRVHVQELKKKYSVGAIPHKALPQCLDLVDGMFGAAPGSAKAAGNGSFLEVTMFPINAIIHPARLVTLLSDWKEGDALDSNPLFYEDMTDEAADTMDKINTDLIAVGKALTAKGVPADVPHIFDWLAVHVYNEAPSSNLQTFFATNDAYKGFRCPLVPGKDSNGKEGYVPDFTNRYFTEDINLGLCGYKGLADIAGVETPTIDRIVVWAQGHMGKEFVVDSKLTGQDVGITNAPQRFGIETIDDLKELYHNGE